MSSMKTIDLNKVSGTECAAIQINGLGHCKRIHCKWQGISACAGRKIIETGYNVLGYKVGENGIEDR